MVKSIQVRLEGLRIQFARVVPRRSSKPLVGATVTSARRRKWPNQPAVAVTFLALTACSTPAEPIVRTVEVKVPVVQPCIPATLDLSPTYPDSDQAVRSAADPGDMLQLLAAGRLLRAQTLREWAAVMKACR